MMDVEDRSAGLLAWQWALYPQGHTERTNLLLHALTTPLFLGGTLLLLTSPALGLASAIAGIGGILTAIVLQGRGHKREPQAPVRFRGPLDVIARLFVEQWVTFPRFVLSGGFARAWRESERS